jgi:hypothetical protein
LPETGILPTTSHVAVMAGTPHHTWLIEWGGVLLTFCWAALEPQSSESASQVAEYTDMSHRAQTHLRIFWGKFSWPLKDEKKWSRQGGQGSSQSSRQRGQMCTSSVWQKQLGTLCAWKMEILAGTEYNSRDFNWESKVTREMSHSEHCSKTNLTASGKKWHWSANCQELYSLRHLLINSQAITAQHERCQALTRVNSDLSNSAPALIFYLTWANYLPSLIVSIKCNK